ncbi:hypothetical protein IBP93_004657 [Vibrio parahaemolyticus]|nr:hypothetical protein [Vibrio parahaemolyticus]
MLSQDNVCDTDLNNIHDKELGFDRTYINASCKELIEHVGIDTIYKFFIDVSCLSGYDQKSQSRLSSAAYKVLQRANSSLLPVKRMNAYTDMESLEVALLMMLARVIETNDTKSAVGLIIEQELMLNILKS